MPASCCWAIISLRNLAIDLLPDLSFPKLSVLTEYAGAAPEEIENLITANLESVFAPIPGVKRVSSVSREGISLVSLEFHWGTDMNFALLHAKEKVEEARSLLPGDCAVPRIIEMDPASKPIVIAVVETRRPDAGNEGLADRRETAELLIKPRLEQLDGVSRVDVQGSGEREVVVSVLPEKLALFHIGYEEVAAAIRDWNQQVLGGTVKKDNIRFVVKVEGEIQEPAEIEKIPLRALAAGHVLIGDVARVRFAEKIKQGEIRLDRRPAIALMIYKESAGNTVTATGAVHGAFRQMEKEFPELRFVTVSEESGLIVSAISNLKQALLQGGLLAFLVLLLFFQNWRDPILIAIISPISVMATFVLMFFAGVNLNIMSLGGLALGIGIFMDNAIVVIENMYRFSFKEDPERSAILATRELFPALLGSSLTTIVIFLPVIYIYGITGRLFRDQSLTISFALLAALVVTVTLLPTLFRVFSRPQKGAEPGAAAANEGGNRILRRAHQGLALPFRVAGFILETLAAFVAAAALMGLRHAKGLIDRGLGRPVRRFQPRVRGLRQKLPRLPAALPGAQAHRRLDRPGHAGRHRPFLSAAQKGAPAANPHRPLRDQRQQRSQPGLRGDGEPGRRPGGALPGHPRREPCFFAFRHHQPVGRRERRHLGEPPRLDRRMPRPRQARRSHEGRAAHPGRRARSGAILGFPRTEHAVRVPAFRRRGIPGQGVL